MRSDLRPLQLPLYGLAAHDLYPDAVVSGRYWFVNDAANFSSTDVDAPALGVDALGFVVGELVHGLESGVYPARPGKDAKNCSYCRVVAACDPSRVDQWHTKANDTLLARYVSLVSNIDVSNTDTADTEVE